MARQHWSVVSVLGVLRQIERVARACPFVSFEEVVVVVVHSSSYALGSKGSIRWAAAVVVVVVMMSLCFADVVVSSNFVWEPISRNHWSSL